MRFLVDESVDDFCFDRTAKREDAKCWSESSRSGIVTAAHYKASQAGAEILAAGGNAVDAAIATSLALGVVESAGSGLGGMTMMMIYHAASKKTTVLEGPCRAPLKADPETIFKLAADLQQQNLDKYANSSQEELAGLVRKSGYSAIAVPTNPAVLGYAFHEFASLPREQLFEPAIRLAEKGYKITPFQEKIYSEYQAQLYRGNAASFFLGPQGKPPCRGEVFYQPALAQPLQKLARKGFADFYTGAIGRQICSDMEKNGGFISAADFAEVPWPRSVKPLLKPFQGWQVASLPPPGGGMVLLEMLGLFQELLTVDYDPESPQAALLLATVIRQARHDRRRYNLGEVTRSGAKAPDLSSREYCRTIASQLREGLSSGGETSHFNVIDKNGNIVAVTQSIERSFGAKTVTQDLGFLYNGFMKGFKLQNRQHPHFLKPGAVARSNAAPTIIFKDDAPLYVIGSTGSERMVSGIFQVLVRLLSQDPFTAVKAPRLHCTPEGTVFFEAERFAAGTSELLRERGFELKAYEPWAFSVGGLHLAGIAGNPDRYSWGVADPRRDGAVFTTVS